MWTISGRRVVGVVAVVVGAGLTLGREHTIRRDLEHAAVIAGRPAVKGDSVLRASAAYHAAHAEAAARARWTSMGHATLGVAAVFVGVAILMTTRRRRTS